MKPNNIYMRRALELASLGYGTAQPNPMVGAVLVHDGRIIGEGYHHRYGEPHAEVMAIASVRDKDRHLLSESTLYVTLEPCSHYGKTPPCAELIIRSGIPHVVVAQLDPFPLVAGKGIDLLRQAGIEVELGCMEDEARQLNKVFNHRYQQTRPYILLKWAESEDGYMDAHRENHTQSPILFSSPYQSRLVHKLRRDYQAILVGANTARLDNPSLTNRHWGERQPIRIILDWRLSLPQDLRVFTDGASPTWVIYDERLSLGSGHQPTEQVRYLASAPSIKAVVELLTREGINSLLVEGGSRTLKLFLEADLYDELQCEKSSIRLGSGVLAPCHCLKT
ncbi:MAG: bifunctional diaminohydroxyphosphoribosylaminopyrimidine deaminase/5-amino-6-(5-phosphoribosylamino)uracil reductase RibD [Porphyromonas sp.]|nr:bifunctional diaminohydroxyphosphoribosylaminopyrimidine deaminase/5-amino-6-(5-phosphoribosylamino)uracil reductase RibD [Porphyromonas sp.]